MPEGFEGNLLEIGRSLKNRSETGRWEFDPPFFEPGQRGSYESVFSELLKKASIEGTFAHYLEERKEDGLSSNVLDLFGSGWFIGSPRNADSVTGLRLMDNSEKLKSQIATALVEEQPHSYFAGQLKYAQGVVKRFSEAQNCKVIEGNAYDGSTWRKLKDNRFQRGFAHYDLIICKPEGAFSPRHISGSGPRVIESREGYLRFFLRLLDRAYQSLSHNNGMLVSQVPEFAYLELENLVPIISERCGVDIFIEPRIGSEGCGGILLVKKTDSSESIEKALYEDDES